VAQVTSVVVNLSIVSKELQSKKASKKTTNKNNRHDIFKLFKINLVFHHYLMYLGQAVLESFYF
jgi:hypothetical protein